MRCAAIAIYNQPIPDATARGVFMRLSDIYRAGKLAISFELFPPKSNEAERELFRNVAELVGFGPSYITCTYGAGGSTRDKTLAIVSRVRQQFGVPVAAHLTCVGSTREQLRDYLRDAASRRIDSIVALRGDPPRGQSSFRPVDGGLRYANELVSLIKSEFPQFGIAVAGYPETHLEAPSPEVDLENLRRKVYAGADVVITQLFYDNEDFLRFRERCAQMGIEVPIVPGVLPITNFAQIKRITSLCGAKLPAPLLHDLETHADDAAAQFEIGVAYAIRQVRELIASGVPGIHFYVLNKSQAAARVLEDVAGASVQERPSPTA
jgi:methylenetetrahydrofolate reductase (NADPH)